MERKYVTLTARHRMRCMVFSQSQKKNNRMISYKEFALVNKGGESFVWDRFLDHQTLGGFPKVKEGSSRGFDGK